MTYFSAIPVPETTIGIAKETTRGTPVAPLYYLPVNSPKYKPNLALLPDETLQGSMVKVYDEVPSLRYDTHSWDSQPYMDSIPNLFEALLGSADTKTTAPTSTTLSSLAAAGASTISTAASIPAFSYIVVDTGVGVLETHYTTAVTGAGPYTVTLAYPLAFAHASAATVTGLTKHQFSLLNNSPTTGNQPPSYTLTDFGGETNWRQMAACQLDGLSISGSADSLPKYTVNWFGNAAIVPTPPTPSFSAAQAPPGWSVVVAIGGAQVAYVVNWNVDLKRQVKPIAAITGTQAYYQYFASALLATAKITVLEDPSATWLAAYEAGTTETLDITLNDVQNGWAFNIHSSKARFTSGEVDRSKEWVEVPLELQLLPNSTDALAGGVSPVALTAANAVTTVY